MNLIKWLSPPKPTKVNEEVIEIPVVKVNTEEILIETISQLNKVIDTQKDIIDSLKEKNSQIDHIEKLINTDLQNKFHLIEEKLKDSSEGRELAKVKEAYHALLTFAFVNINPVTDFDPAHARKYWQDLVK